MQQEIKIHPIGQVISSVSTQTDEAWGKVACQIQIQPEYQKGLEGLAEFSHVIVITWLHQAAFCAEKDLVRRPRGLASMPMTGIFAQRAKDRPNPIGITAVSIVSVENDRIHVKGLDAINGTPVLDIKPYYPDYDRIEGATVPEWVYRLMAGYFRDEPALSP